MPILNFKEISQANIANGHQDAFELFARDFLYDLGYDIVSDPSRGADGGKDFIVKETRIGIRQRKTVIRWMVSCKHNAHSKSGKSVTPDDERNIRDRVESHNCDGFMGFYSTLPSSGLSEQLDRLGDKFDYQIFDKEKIEGELLSSEKGKALAKRYFPQSMKEYFSHFGSIDLRLYPGKYHIVIKGKKTCEFKDVELKSERNWILFTNKGANHILYILIICKDNLSPPEFIDFSKKILPDGLNFERGTTASYYPDLMGKLTQAKFNEPRFEEIEKGVRALLIEPMRTNLFCNSSKPETRRVSLHRGIYTLWIKGEGSAEIVLPKSEKIVREGKPLVFVVRDRKIFLIKISGELTQIQLENGKGATSFIETKENCTVTRSPDAVRLDILNN